MHKVILFYHFFPVPDPEVFRLWQLELCRRLDLTGRVIIAPHGLNATLAGDLDDLRAYKRSLGQVPALAKVEIKWSPGGRGEFPGLSVKVRPELVSLRPGQQFDVYDSSTGLSPQQWHRFLTDRPQTLVVDARNDYESAIGYFDTPNLIKPPIKSFAEIKSLAGDWPKDEPILTYCTGDVRCEYLSAYLKDQGFGQVHHLRGGIIRYGQTYRDRGFWRGQCYVFDSRGQIGFGDSPDVVSCCQACRKPASQQINCDGCNQQIIVCPGCQANSWQHCRPAVGSGQRSGRDRLDHSQTLTE